MAILTEHVGKGVVKIHEDVSRNIPLANHEKHRNSGRSQRSMFKG